MASQAKMGLEKKHEMANQSRRFLVGAGERETWNLRLELALLLNDKGWKIAVQEN